MSTTRIEKYLNNEDVMKVAYKAASTFSKVLSQDEIKSCVMNALWKADANYDEANTTKFTSYLHKGVVFECLTQRKFNQRKGGEKTLSHLIGDKRDYFSAIDFKDAIDVSMVSAIRSVGMAAAKPGLVPGGKKSASLSSVPALRS